MPETLLTPAAAEGHLGDPEASRAAFEEFAAQTSLDRFGRLYGTRDMMRDPAWANLVEGIRLAGITILPP